MKILAATALLFMFCIPAQAQYNWSWYEAQQQTFALQQIAHELSWQNHYRAGGYYQPSYRASYRTNYCRPRYNRWRSTYGGWGWTNGGF